MKHRAIILSFALLFASAGFSQSEKLSNLMTKIKTQVKEVGTQKATYKQTVTSPSTGVINYNLDEVDDKGEITNYTWQFNLADIDPYTVRQETDGDLLIVTMNTANKQSLIQTTEQGENSDYEDEVEFRAVDVDNARKLVDLIKEAIPLAEEMLENKLSLNDYEEMVNWLSQNVGEVRLGEVSYKQSISKGEFPGSLTFTKTIVEADGSEEQKYTFNLSDINPNSVKFEISGSKLGVNFVVLREEDLIEYRENNLAEPFTDEATIVTDDVEKARDLRTVLSLAIPKAQEVTENALPKIASQQEALASVSKFIQTVNYGETTIEQTITEDCVARLSVITQEEKKTEKVVYELNLMDINPNVLNYQVSGRQMYFEPVTNNENKLIKEFENDEFKGYTDELKLYAKDVEIARRLRHALQKAITICTENYSVPFSENTQSALDWMIANIPEVNLDGVTWKQSLERVGDGNNKVKFTQIEIDDKGGTESVYEFNFSDLNPRGLRYEISGKDLSLSLNTNYESEIIKHYENGEIQDYAKEMEIVFADIEQARHFIQALETVINSLSKE